MRSGSRPVASRSTQSGPRPSGCAQAVPAAASWRIEPRRVARDRNRSMTREEVLTLVRRHLAEELEMEENRIVESSRFKEDLDADSLDLYELVMELEDTYGISVSEEQAARIATVGDAVDFVLEHAPA